jgi:hypothetical protein
VTKPAESWSGCSTTLLSSPFFEENSDGEAVNEEAVDREFCWRIGCHDLRHVGIPEFWDAFARAGAEWCDKEMLEARLAQMAKARAHYDARKKAAGES